MLRLPASGYPRGTPKRKREMWALESGPRFGVQSRSVGTALSLAPFANLIAKGLFGNHQSLRTFLATDEAPESGEPLAAGWTLVSASAAEWHWVLR
jgi:hypothetical protein